MDDTIQYEKTKAELVEKFRLLMNGCLTADPVDSEAYEMIRDGIRVLVDRDEKARERLRGTTAQLDVDLLFEIDRAIDGTIDDLTKRPAFRTTAAKELQLFLVQRFDSNAPSEDEVVKWFDGHASAAELERARRELRLGILSNVKQHARGDGGKP